MIKQCFVTVVFTVIFMVVHGLSVHADEMLDVQSISSNQGIEAWLVEDHSVPIISIAFAFRDAGAHNDPLDKQGLARMVSNTMDEGAGDIDSLTFQKTLTDHSITLQYSAGRDHFTGALRTLVKHKETAFDLLEKSLTQPRFDNEPFERMRESNLSRIRSSLSDPDWIAARINNDVVYDDHPYAHNTGGTLTTLTDITPDDARAFHDQYINQSNLVVAVAGDITPDALAALLDKVFGTLPRGQKADAAPSLNQQNQSKIFVYNKDVPQTSIIMTAPSIEKSDPDYYASVVMNHLFGGGGFGSQLMEVLREQNGLTYGVYSHLFHMSAFDGIQISMATQNDTVKRSIDLIEQETRAFVQTPIDDQALRDAKDYLNGSVLLSLTSTNAIAGTLLSFQLDALPINYLSERVNGIEAVKAIDVQNAAKKILQEGAFTTILVGQPSDVSNAIIIDTLPNVE